MNPEANPFSLLVGYTHFLNLLLFTFLVRSGIQILFDHPRLYWNDHSIPGSEFIKFTKKEVPRDCLYTSLDDCLPISPWLALPGKRHALGVGRQWHFFIAFLWILNGLLYVTSLFTTGGWRRLIPTSWDFFPKFWEAFLSFAAFHLPRAELFCPYDPVQEVSYAFVIFILAPLMIVTGFAMFPAVSGRFPGFLKFFGGRQKARTIHFLGMVAFICFVVIHVTLVTITGFSNNMVHIILGKVTGNNSLAVFLFWVGISVIILSSIAATIWTTNFPRQVQTTIGVFIHSVARFFFYSWRSRQNYKKQDISPYFWVNGYPPTSDVWLKGAQQEFQFFQLEVKGLVKNPCSLSLERLKQFPKREQTTLHCCIQGWSGIASWSGVPVSEIIRFVQPLPEAKYIIFYSYQMNAQEVGDTRKKVPYYGSLELHEAEDPQTILAYEMNEKPLPLNHGAPLRLRLETQLGFKMVKWINAIEFVDDLKKIGLGYGGFREDHEFYNRNAQI